MTFSALLDKITPATSTGPGRGFTVSLLKALTHASVIRATDTTEYAKMSADVRKAELTAIADHLSPDRLLDLPAASTEFNTMVGNLRAIGKAIGDEGPTWTEKETRERLSALTDRIVTICQKVDFEFGGLTNAEAGDQL
jgi:hypothetical protein